MAAYGAERQGDAHLATTEAALPWAPVFECSPLPQLLIQASDPEFTILLASGAYLRQTGLKREVLAGRSVSQAFPEAQRALVLASLRRVLATGTADTLHLQKPDEVQGVLQYWCARNTPVPAPDGQIAYILFSLEEPSHSARDAFLVRLHNATWPLADPDEIVAVSARLLTEHLDADRCSYGIYESDWQVAHLSLQYVRPGAPAFRNGVYQVPAFGSSASEAMRTGVPYIVRDAETDRITADSIQTYRELRIRAMVSIPLHRAGKLVASMTVTDCTKARNWLPDEVELVRLVANRCWESIERSRVTSELRASEQRLHLAQRAARIGSFEWFMKDDRILLSAELEALYGIPEGSFPGGIDAWRSLVVPSDAAAALEKIQQTAARRQAECVYEFRVILPDGTNRWLRGRSQLFYDASGVAERMVGVNIDISAQKQAQDDLEQIVGRLRAIFDGTYEYIGLLSPDGAVIESNRAMLEFGGNSLNDIAGKPFWDTPWFASAPLAREAVRQGIAKAAAGEFVRFEATVRRPDGECPTFDISLYPVRNEHGEVVFIVPEGRDITERKLAEERLQQQWHTFDTALSNSPDLTYTFDPQGRFTYANKKLCEVSQRSLRETVGKTPTELGYPADLAERIQNQLRQVIASKKGLRDETAFRLKTGEVREYEYLYEPVIGESGEVEAIAGATRDVTRRKEAEEQLRASENKFRQLFDALPQLVWSALPDGYEDLYNKRWFEYTGLSYDEVAGYGSRIIHPDDLPLSAERWERSLATGQPYENEYRCRRYDGTYRWFLGRANPVLDEHGNVVRWFGTCTDIHDKKQSETALIKAHRQLEEFSYVASHDLQEPLRMVNIYSQLMLKQAAATQGDFGLYAGYVRQGVKRMETLLNDLLSFSRIVQLEPEQDETGSGQAADLTDALAEAQSVLCTRIQENDAVITATPLPQVRGDTRQLSHVFQNLISNSLKYRHADRRPEIQVSVTGNEKEWIVAFQDNGIGFEPKYAQRIFGLFKRLHKDDYPGTGLGLAICQRIVERYGGRIWAEGRPGEGSTFYVALLKL